MISREFLKCILRSSRTAVKTPFHSSYRPVLICRHFASDKKNFTPIYRCPIITAGALLNKFKRWHLLAVSALVPGTYGLSLAEICSPELFDNALVAGGVSTLALFGLGQIFSNMVGYIYVSEDFQTVRISILDFWGRRVNEDVPKEDLIPIPNCAKYPTDFFFLRIYRYSSKKSAKINMKFGEVLNAEAFEYIFDYNPE